jgi:hypothetical protein
MRKNKGPAFFREAGTEAYHTDEELREFLTRAACAATAHIDYAVRDPLRVHVVAGKHAY